MTSTLVDIQAPREQKMVALGEANVRRCAVSRTRGLLRDGLVGLADVLDDDAAGSLRLYELLLDVPRCGETGMRRIVHRAGARTGARYGLACKRLRELSPLQRQAVVDEARRALPGRVA